MKPRKPKAKVLVIEDELPLLEILQFNLERDGYEVLTASDGLQGLELAKTEAPDVVILDLNLPTLDGIEICRELRTDTATRGMLIVMLTARSEETDQIVGLSVGADDYVTKPFNIKVLLLKLQARLHRERQTTDSSDHLECHGIVLDRVGHHVTCDGEPITLTPTEFRLLETLMRTPGRAFSRADLLSAAIGDETIVLERTIDVHIRSLRQKLGNKSSYIETVRGVGYRLAKPDE